MAQKVTPEMIEQINAAYIELKTYAAVGRKFGLSGTTIKKYIISDYTSKEDVAKNPITADKINSIADYICSKEILNLPTALCLSKKEQDEIEIFWKELTL